jgi:hypothetical protein
MIKNQTASRLLFGFDDDNFVSNKNKFRVNSTVFLRSFLLF